MQRRRYAIAVWVLVLAACAPASSKDALPDGSADAAVDGAAIDGARRDGALDLGGDAAPSDAVSGCVFSFDYACHRCAGGIFGKDYGVGCKAQDDCRVFCGPIPPPYVYCAYGGPGESEPTCDGGWTYTRGTLAGCAYWDGAYDCAFCVPGAAYVVTFAREGASGPCLKFWDSCVPAGFGPCMP